MLYISYQMTTQSISPPPAVGSYVSSITVIEQADPLFNFALPLIANGYPCIAFQVADDLLTAGTGDKISNLVLYGQFIKPGELCVTGRFTIIACFLYPAVVKPLFGYSANEFTNNSIDLSFLPPAREMHLREQLLNTISLEARLQLLYDYILRLAARHDAGINKGMVYATQLIRKQNGLISLKDIQQELYVTERTFQRLFDAYVGLSPRLFSRICQFDAAFQQLNLQRPARLIDIAYQYGYADESHFIRSFKEFTNLSPTAYLKKSAPFVS